MITLLQTAPFFLFASVVITLFLVYRISKLRQLGTPRQEETASFGRSLTALSLYELGRTVPNFAPFVAIMRDEVRRDRQRLGGSWEFLAECERSLRLGVADARTFSRLFDLYEEMQSSMER